jgi:chaperonin GroEL (HSP60 family)
MRTHAPNSPPLVLTTPLPPTNTHTRGAGKVRNNVDAGVLEPALSKTKMIQVATEAAITILRIDDLITLAPPPPEAGEE